MMAQPTADSHHPSTNRARRTATSFTRRTTPTTTPRHRPILLSCMLTTQSPINLRNLLCHIITNVASFHAVIRKLCHVILVLLSKVFILCCCSSRLQCRIDVGAIDAAALGQFKKQDHGHGRGKEKSSLFWL